MSLRDILKATVARCTHQQMQHATFDDPSATGNATQAQQTPAIPHEIRVHAATVIATAMQQRQEGSATLTTLDDKLQVARPSTLTRK